ncbi:FecR domain-containing protein [Sphingomonas sp. dw_22]|uniref:FecR family protein n=1 Tax=Sphingomonas sp. dw_22 TaxID=2721175 RepID=UPI001BD50FB7|nr:FecR domain-containing protein [Sphingomonas sp. dw_22]
MSNLDPTDPDDEAVRWATHAAYGEMTDATRSELEAWLNADRRHRGAFFRAQAGLCAMEDAVGQAHVGRGATTMSAGRDLPASPRPPGAGAVASPSAAALSAVGVPIFPAGQVAQADHVVKLKDGSIVTLGSEGRIEVAISDSARQIVLLSGEARFKVAKDTHRPFVVRSGAVFAQATGTEYSVKRFGRFGGTVSVREGRVLVWERGEGDQAVLLRAGASLKLDPGPNLPPIRPVPTPLPQLAQIRIKDEPIAMAVARFNRINRTQIVLDDPKFGKKRIIGLFKANEPEQFAEAAAALVGAEVLYRDGQIVIKTK